MTEPRWYCITSDGAATLCVDQADAEQNAADADIQFPRRAPHRAVQLVEAAPQPQQAAADPLQGAADWLKEALPDCRIADLQASLRIGYNRASRLFDAATPPQQAPTTQRKALTNADVVEAWRTTEAARSDYGWTSCEWFQAGVRFAQRFYGITQPSQQEQNNV